MTGRRDDNEVPPRWRSVITPVAAIAVGLLAMAGGLFVDWPRDHANRRGTPDRETVAIVEHPGAGAHHLGSRCHDGCRPRRLPSHVDRERRDPVLGNHMAEHELSRYGNFLTGLKLKDEYLAGPATDTSRAIVQQLVGSVGVVADCDFDGSTLVNGRTHQVVKRAVTQRALVNARLEVIDGVWKVTEFSNLSVGCTTAR